MTLKLSKPSKIPCKSFALEAMLTCPGAKYADGTIKEVCQSCYAMKGSYSWPIVRKVRQDNLEASKRDDFVSEMIILINKQKRNKYFRWFDSGDIYSNAMLIKVYEICKATPSIKHWIPTKSRELFENYIWDKLESLPNVKVRYSSPSVNGGYIAGLHGSTVVSNTAMISSNNKEIYMCPSSKQEGKCKNCRACWSKKIDVVAYIKH